MPHRFLDDITDHPKAERLWRTCQAGCDEVEMMVTTNKHISQCLERQWRGRINAIRDNDDLGPSMVYVQTDGNFQFLDGRNRAIVRRALGRPVPTYQLTDDEVIEWQSQR